MQVRGKAAVVTGGATGIGLGLAEALVEQGCRVMIADIEAEKAKAAAEKLRAKGGTVETAACNVADHASVAALADAAWAAFGNVDLVFNNAGVGANANVIDADPTEVDWIWGVNIKGVWNGCSIFGKRFVEQGTEAAICVTASEHALGVPHLGQGIYTASKHAVLGLSDVLRNELPVHVQVSVVCPGLVHTELHNAGRNGPNGAAPAEALALGAKVMARGMDPLEIGRKTIAGVEKGEFLIMTHPHARTIAEKRWNDIEEAFKRAASVENAAQYDVNTVVAAVLSGSGD